MGGLTAVVEHDCEIGDHVHLATGALLASTVRVGDGVHVGVGASVRQCLTIGENSVVGAGAVGLELGSVWLRLGAKVTVVEMLPNIAPFADAQMSGSLQRALAAQGLEFHLESRVTAIEGGPCAISSSSFGTEMSSGPPAAPRIAPTADPPETPRM